MVAVPRRVAAGPAVGVAPVPVPVVPEPGVVRLTRRPVVPPVAGGVGPPGVVDVPAAHPEALRTLLIRLIWPLRASTRPCTVAPLLSEMSLSAIRLPWNAVVVSSVAELPTCQ